MLADQRTMCFRRDEAKGCFVCFFGIRKTGRFSEVVGIHPATRIFNCDQGNEAPAYLIVPQLLRRKTKLTGDFLSWYTEVYE